ncbi:uncharacterized protein [Dysidea avara]|uniref:uncharacterized protein isoform X2 n=1 Tax=Dysidea avara TaxID=196820 RepID=UPI0033289636
MAELSNQDLSKKLKKFTLCGIKPLTEELDPVTSEKKILHVVDRCKEFLNKITGEAEVLKLMIEDCLNDDPDMRPSITHLAKLIKPLRELPPLIPALQSGCYELTWEKCKDLPFPLFCASVALLNEKVYVMAGTAPEDDIFDHVYCYSIMTDKWERVPNPGQYYGMLHTINDKLTIIGGRDIANRKITNKVSTYTNETWINHYPHLLKARSKPGVVSHSYYIIVVGGGKDEVSDHNDIELLDWTQPSHWVMTCIALPEPMWNIFPSVSKDIFCIVGYSGPGTTSNSTAYQLAVDTIISCNSQPATSDGAAQWMKLPSAPHCDTRMIPYSYPPVIIGGLDIQGVPTSDITMLDYSSHTWKRVASLSSPRDSVAVVSINCEAIIVLGGISTGSLRPPRPQYLTTVEKGRATLTKNLSVTSIPVENSVENSMCCIQ